MPRVLEKCPHCELKPLPCPFCGSPGEIFADNMVGCSDPINCGGNVDFGHWTGEDDKGVPAVHFVIEQWNKRAGCTLGPSLAAQISEDDACKLLNMQRLVDIEALATLKRWKARREREK